MNVDTILDTLNRNGVDCHARAIPSHTASGVTFLALSDRDLLACQNARKSGSSERVREQQRKWNQKDGKQP